MHERSAIRQPNQGLAVLPPQEFPLLAPVLILLDLPLASCLSGSVPLLMLFMFVTGDLFRVGMVGRRGGDRPLNFQRRSERHDP